MFSIVNPQQMINSKKQYLNLYLTSTDGTITLLNPPQELKTITSLKIINWYLITNSATAKIYYLDCPDICPNKITNSIGNNSLIPLYVGSYDFPINIVNQDFPVSIPTTITYRIRDTTNAISSDTIKLNLLLEYN